MSRASSRARDAFLRACALDVAVRKPGNVSVHSPGHGMDAALFLASAQAAAGPLCEAGARVGPRIEAAVRATASVAGCNTNLGIVLLCAPLALAAERHPQAGTAEALRTSLCEVLADLDQADAQAAYRAIALANPGGLGSAAEQDVHTAPSVDLRTAMALAADRDSIALQYRDGYPLVFDTGLPTLAGGFDGGHRSRRDETPDATTVQAVQRSYLALLSGTPDSHIARKHGTPAADAVMRAAQPWHARAAAAEALDAEPAFCAWDAALKAERMNPGTTADLLVASMMVAALTPAGVLQKGMRIRG